jgi:hypothetical protein
MLQKALAVKFAAEAEATAETICKAKKIVMHDLDVLVDRANDPDMKGELLLNNKTMVQLLDRVVMLERIITGQSTSKSESRSTVDRTDRIIKQVIVDQSSVPRRTRTIDADVDSTNDEDMDQTEGSETEDGGTGESSDLPAPASPPHSGPMRTVRRGAYGKHV